MVRPGSRTGIRVTPWRDRGLAAEALLWLGLVRIAVSVFPFRWLVRILRLGRGEPDPGKHAVSAGQVERMGWAVRAAAARAPWESACLVQAVAAMVMLRVRGLPGTLYLGVARDHEAGRPFAHAWLRCADVVLTGRVEHERFETIAVFSHGGRSVVARPVSDRARMRFRD